MSQPGNNRRYIFFGLASLAVLMSSIDTTIVIVGLPELGKSLDASLGWLGWVLTIYQLVQVIVMPVVGRLSDTLGRKKVFLFCTAMFTIGSFLCAMAPSVGWLIAFRALQAIGGGGMMPSAVGIVSDQFRERRAQAIGLFTSIFPVGGIVGPNLGGYILEHWTWRELFMINVPIGFVILFGVFFLLTDARPARAKAFRADFVGLALFAGAVVALLFGMTEISNNPALVGSRYIWAVFAASVILAIAFVYHIRRTSDAVVDYKLLVTTPFWAANLYNFIFGAALFGFSSFVPYYAVVKFGMSPAQSGAVVTPRAVAMMVVAALASIFVIRLGYRLPMILGIALVSISMVLLGFGWQSAQVGGLALDAFWLMATIVAIGGVGMGLASPASNNAALDLAPHKSAEITGLRGMFRTTGGVIGIAVVVMVVSFSADQAAALDHMFMVLAGLLLFAVPLTFIIPDSARARRLSDDRGPDEAPAEPVAVQPRVGERVAIVARHER